MIDDPPHVLLAAGTTATARIEGISAAGAAPAAMVHTPSADAEIVAYGGPALSPVVPVAPTGCPTPAVVTRAARDVLGFEWTTVDAGLGAPTGAPTVDVGASPGRDLRATTAVPGAADVIERAREVGASVPADRLAIAETIPGGTTTAMAVLRALGERSAVSSSLPENPIERKHRVVETGLDASALAPGDCAGAPTEAIAAVGDPVQATVLGLLEGALERDTAVELWGGTQQLAIAALARHAGVEASLTVATTSYVAADPSAAVRDLAADLDVDLRVTDPGFAGADHVAMDRFEAGEAKEGVGMGGALSLAERAGALPAVRDRVRERYAALSEICERAAPAGDGAASHADRVRRSTGEGTAPVDRTRASDPASTRDDCGHTDDSHGAGGDRGP